jgi:hypothetical protein
MKAVLPLLVLLALAACGRESASTDTSGGATRAAAARSEDDSVAAISLSSAKPAVLLRFAVAGKLRVGVATPVRLDVSGEPGSVTLRAQGEGLLIEPAAAALTLPDDGTAATQTLQVTPQAAGITEMMVRIQMQGEGAADVPYAVPLLVEDAAKP